ncbi:hypothetical protein GCM10011309_03890 [Litorimonas cladophorae]|uniref:CinA C-terminal domain-containing protein n=1 Tax=Litorimonas cladophorae TaxID=1220491 RepID=A0A918KBZ6_9PROT|nr:CinA family protein [Litorimonas cladophorae]GGX57978.1 hypothetical protein GCM10011309_03890 [Litorimonas cladophorae]
MSQNMLAEIFSLSAKLLKTATEQGQTIATAESCTGGLIGAAITSAPGSSTAFRGGIIAYHNDIKIEQLAVDPAIIAEFGAVSGPVAEQMASGCLNKLGVDIAVSVTGVAGPGGGSAEKPVGTVWMGVATRQGVYSAKHFFDGMDRNKVRDHTCLAALKALLAELDQTS